MEVELRVKRVGNSVGVIIPKSIARSLNIKEGESIVLEIRRKTPKSIFGILKGKKLDPEAAKVFREDEKW